MFSTVALTSLTDSGAKGNRQWLPNQLYSGHVLSIAEDGSIAVQINNKIYQALAHRSAQTGDKLSLRLLGTEPEPHFAIVGILRRLEQPQSAVQVPNAWREAVSLLRTLDPGIAALTALLQRYPLELARLSPHLTALLRTIDGRALPAEDLLKPGKLKAHALQSGSFHESDTAEETDSPDMKSLLFRLLGILQHKRQLTLVNGRPAFVDKAGSAAQNLQDRTAALYATEQETDSGASTLRQLLSLNVENALLQMAAGQVSSLLRSDGDFSIWIMQLMIKYENLTVPVELEFRKNLTSSTEHWEALFSLELPHSGRIHAELLVKKPAVDIRLSSQNAELVELWHGHRAGLKNMLVKLGLELQEFHCMKVEAS